MSDTLETRIAAALQAQAQAEADERQAELALADAKRVAQQSARDHAADLLDSLGVHQGDRIILAYASQYSAPRVSQALLVDARTFAWEGDDIPDMAQRVGITLTLRAINRRGQPVKATHTRILWLPPLQFGLRIAGPEFQERNP